MASADKFKAPRTRLYTVRVGFLNACKSDCAHCEATDLIPLTDEQAKRVQVEWEAGRDRAPPWFAESRHRWPDVCDPSEVSDRVYRAWRDEMDRRREFRREMSCD